jgi:hypothetical protein
MKLVACAEHHLANNVGFAARVSANAAAKVQGMHLSQKGKRMRLTAGQRFRHGARIRGRAETKAGMLSDADAQFVLRAA